MTQIAWMYSPYGVRIGDNCRIMPNVMLGSSFKNGVSDVQPPSVGNNVFIGTGAVVLENIHVGDNTIIGANAVVIKDVRSNSYALGVPARIYSIHTEDVSNN